MLISALVSAYNSEKWLPGRLDNLLAQGLGEQLEILVIDSGSQQNEASLVAEYQRRHTNIVYLRTPRESLYAAWNRAIGLARGRYLTSANCDDRLGQGGLRALLDCLQDDPRLDLVYADGWQTSDPEAVLSWDGHSPHQLVRRARYRHQRLLLNCIVGPQPVWKRSLHDQLGLFDGSFEVAGDWEFWLRLAENKKTLFHLDRPLGLYLNNPQGLERCDPDRVLRENQRVLTKYLSLRQ